MKSLSSAQTFVMKIVFPIFWIVLFGAGMIAMWSGALHGRNGAPPPAIKWQFLCAWIIGSAFILWFSAALKRVRVDARNLYVSNYLREAAIPLRNIESVTENRWINVHPVTVHFRAPTEFGQKITFMPKVRFLAFWSSHPVVSELEQLAKSSRAEN